MVSSPVDLTDTGSAHISFDYILRYANASELTSNYQLLISADYSGMSGEIATATWTPVEFNLVQGSDWETWANSGNVNVPAEFLGKERVFVALRYIAKAKAATWEVKNFVMKQGAGDYKPGVPPTDEVKTPPYAETFASSLGSFTSVLTSGAGAWICDYSTAKATGYDNASQVTTAGTYYLVSPEIDLSGITEAHVAYEYIIQYSKGDDNQQVLITDSYNAETPAEGWTLLNQTHVTDLKTTEGKTDWYTFTKADLAIPADFLGKKIRIAFRYNTDNVNGSTWEVRNFSIAAGKIGEGEEEGGDAGDPDALNGDFEAWVNGQPVNWKSTTTASKGAVTQSTDAHGGTYSVEVAGTTSGNNRLAYKEITLPAGTYTMTFYAKAASATGGTVCPGYVPVVNGKVGSYKYGEYVNDITNTEWIKVTHEFSLTEATTINPVVMVAKNPGGNVLFDDFTLTDAGGKEYIK